VERLDWGGRGPSFILKSEGFLLQGNTLRDLFCRGTNIPPESCVLIGLKPSIWIRSCDWSGSELQWSILIGQSQNSDWSMPDSPVHPSSLLSGSPPLLPLHSFPPSSSSPNYFPPPLFWILNSNTLIWQYSTLTQIKYPYKILTLIIPPNLRSNPGWDKKFPSMLCPLFQSWLRPKFPSRDPSAAPILVETIKGHPALACPWFQSQWSHKPSTQTMSSVLILIKTKCFKQPCVLGSNPNQDRPIYTMSSSYKECLVHANI